MNQNKIPILIIDDEEELLEMYQEYFSDYYLVFAAASAKDGIKIFNEHPEIKLIISDSKMEDMSGLQLLKHLNETYRTFPVFYLATGDFDRSEDDLKKLGASRLILKPFDLDEILIKINEDLNQK